MEGMYGSAGQDYFPIDDLLDLSNDDLFSSSTSSTDSDHHHHPPPPQHHPNPTLFLPPSTDLFSNDLCLPSDDVAELEWLSRFVDDSFTDFPTAELSGSLSFPQNDKSFSTTSRVRTKRSKPASAANFDSTWAGSSEPNSPKPKPKREAAEASTTTRRCAHCASEKTPQWRAGPMGPKTLCNACGVRYKSGRLVPEYRPAASPTFVLTQHSNSHRKVMELRRQKELSRPHNHREETQQQQEQEQQQFYLHHNGFQVC